MATVKYASASPYVEQATLHPSDHRQADYEARLQGPEAGRGNPTVKRIGLVLFGTGRQVRKDIKFCAAGVDVRLGLVGV